MLVCLMLRSLKSRAVVIRHDKDDAEALRLGRRCDAVGRVFPDGKRRSVTNVAHDAGPRCIFIRFDEPLKGT